MLLRAGISILAMLCLKSGGRIELLLDASLSFQ
jgi:hypothetical protein